MSPQELHQSRLRRAAVDGIRQKPMVDLTGATLAVIGLDPDGFSLAKAAAAHGFETVGFDADEVKVAQLDAAGGQSTERNLSITTDGSQLRKADVFIVCTGSSLPGAPDLAHLEAASATVGENLREGSLVIVSTVVFPGVCDHVVLPILERTSGLARQAPGSRGDFFFAHAPVLQSRGAPRIIGASDHESLARAAAFYRIFPNEIISLPSVKEAEAVRMVEDSLHDASLAIAGEFSVLFDRIGIDIVSVLGAVRPESLDTWSLSGVGIPRSSPSAYYLARSGHEHEIDRQFLTSARRIVEHMPEYATVVLFDALREQKKPLKGTRVALLGLSDLEGKAAEKSVGLRIRDALVRKGADVKAYDPYVTGAGSTLKETLEGADAVVIASRHAMFCNLHARQFEEFGISIVVDACNCLDKRSFENSPVVYRGIGRGT
ncbi:MAG TPA: UDP binding domain-containing protein [Candidatus Paceibacterota bacterium]|jgi:nucleotide sugar dehydrogenase|nr:UDP binding domain-containing protein [Candidatus Paceibacterota bacterium]